MICCICKVEEIKGMGNNPEPVKSMTGRFGNRCCDFCNYSVVLPARMASASAEIADKAESVAKELEKVTNQRDNLVAMVRNVLADFVEIIKVEKQSLAVQDSERHQGWLEAMSCAVSTIETNFEHCYEKINKEND